MTRRLLLIVNPRSGRRRALTILEQLKPLFAEAAAAIDVQVTRCPGDARRIAKEADLERYDGLCLVGGDGTIHEVINGLMDRDNPASISLGIIPCGTGNDVAKQLAIENPRAGAQRLIAAESTPFDVLRVEVAGAIYHCVTLVGWAGVADINGRAERLRLLGSPRYAVATLRQILSPKRRKATLLLDDRTIEGEFLLVAACNTVFSGSGMRLAPRARIDDGKMDVIVLGKASRWHMLRMFGKVFNGSHIGMPCVQYHQTGALEILSRDHGPLDLDGEIIGTTPAAIEVVPGAVRFFV